MSKIPSEDSEILYKLRIPESAQHKTVLELYDMDIHQKISAPNYQKLKTMVKRSTDQKLRLRNFDARRGRIETGAVVKSRKRLTCVEGGKGTCFKWKEKGQCSQGDRCSLRHETQDRKQKREHTTYPSQPYHEVEVCRGREVSEAKVTNCPLFDNRADIICRVLARERFVNIGIRTCANFSKQKRVVSQETRVCFFITRLMNNQIKGRRKATFTKRRK